MLNAARAVAKSRETGTPLPEVPALADMHDGWFRFRPRGGQVTMIAGQPGSQKSGLALWWAAMMNVPTLYFSADLAAHTAITRVASAITGDTSETVARGLNQGGEAYYAEQLSGLNIHFVFDPNPTSMVIKQELDAWVEMWDTWPRLIVVDNLMDVVPEVGDNEYSGYKQVLLEAKTVARLTGAAVFILHHMQEGSYDPHWPAPRKALQGKVSQTPENILSVAVAEDPELFRWTLVKQRSGPSDPAATKDKVGQLRVDPSRNTFERWVPLDPVRQHVEAYWREREGAA